MSAWIGQMFMSLSLYGCQQNFVQRYCSMKSEKKVQKYIKYRINSMKIHTNIIQNIMYCFVEHFYSTYL